MAKDLIMLKINNKPPKLFTPEKAEEMAEMMQANDDEWTFKAKHDPKGTGYSLVEVYDEEGEFVSYL